MADIAAYDAPRTVLEGLQSCAHCHTFSPDGRVFGMDVDRNGDKGGYFIGPVTSRMQLDEGHFITWNAFRPEDAKSSMGLFTKVSPCGRYLVSTVQGNLALCHAAGYLVFPAFFPD